MNSSDKRLLEFIARLAYNIDGLSGELKLYFSQFLTFHFSRTLSKSQIEHVENKKASKRFDSRDEIAQASKEFSVENKIWCVAAIQLLQIQAEQADDRIVSRKIGKLLNDLISVFELQNENDKIVEERTRIEKEIHQFENRPTIKIPARIWPLALDYILRFIFLLSFSYLDMDKAELTGINTFLIPIVILSLASLIGRQQRKANLQLLNHYGGAHLYKIEYEISTGRYTWLAFFLGTSVFISYLLPDQLHVLALVGLTLYYFIYVRFFRVGRIEENDLVRQLDDKVIDTSTLSIDQNDEVIVALETKLNSSTSRLEAYVLESALFGALSFSGFLQIMATDLVSFKDLEDFATYIFSTSQAFIHFDWNTFNAGLTGLSNKQSLFCLVSVESLICSIFFLAVIASRLRFSDIADKVRTAINLAKAYNAKEETLHDEQQITGKKLGRLDELTAKVNEQLHEATLILDQIKPVMLYMEYFRNAGILAFLIILISSSLFITSTLGWTFLALVLATYFYFNRTRLSILFKALFLNFRIQFVKKGFWLFIVGCLFQVAAYVLRIFLHVNSFGTVLFALSYFIMSLYVFAWLILSAHVDEKFGEIETQKDFSRQSRWKVVKNTMAILILMYGVAQSFVQLRLEGAHMMIMISLSALAMLMSFVGYYLTKVRWLGIICGYLMATCSIGILFKNLHLPGASEMIVVSSAASLILMPVVIWKRQLFHQLLIRFVVVTFVLAVYYNPFFYKIPMSLSLAYQHASPHVNEIFQVLEDNNSQLFIQKGDAAIDKGIASCDWYIHEFKRPPGFSGIYDDLIEEYSSFVVSVLNSNGTDSKIDSARLPQALKIAKQQTKILRLLNYSREDIFPLEMESNVLLAMGRKEEAIQSLQNIVNDNPSEEFKAQLRNRIAEIQSQR